MRAAQKPAHVAPEQALARRMRIAVAIGLLVVTAVVSRPPQRPALRRAGADDCEHELDGPRRLEGSMRKVAMVERGDCKHSYQITEREYRNRHPRHANPENRE